MYRSFLSSYFFNPGNLLFCNEYIYRLQLAQSTEEKMLAIMPEKERKRYLALKSTASSDEIALATADIQKWQVSTRSIDTQLKAGEFKNEFKSDNLRTEELFPLINKSQREKILDAGKKMKSDEMSHFQRERRAGMYIISELALNMVTFYLRQNRLLSI